MCIPLLLLSLRHGCPTTLQVSANVPTLYDTHTHTHTPRCQCSVLTSLITTRVRCNDANAGATRRDATQRNATQRANDDACDARDSASHERQQCNNEHCGCLWPSSESQQRVVDGRRTNWHSRFLVRVFPFCFFEWLRVTSFIPILAEPGICSTTVCTINANSKRRPYAV